MNNLTHKELTQDDLDMYFFYRNKGIHSGFFLRYLKFLPLSKTTVEAFNTTNDEYFELFGEYKYCSITSFRNQLKKYLEK